MKFHCIEVSGIMNITFNRKVLWQAKGGYWIRSNENGVESSKRHDEMMAIVNILKWDRRYRMWVHGDTLNIVRKKDSVSPLARKIASVTLPHYQ